MPLDSRSQSSPAEPLAPDGAWGAVERASWLDRAGPWMLALYAVAVTLVALQRGLSAHHHWTYPVFRESFYHLIHHQNLYAHYPAQGYDLFKYSPTFALLYAPFALLPFTPGLVAWDLVNMLALYLALIWLLPRREAALATMLLTPEVIAAAQASQSDSLVAALIILAFVAFERERQLGAAVAVGAGAAIKIFPLAALSFAITHRRPWRFALLFATTIVVLVALPLVVVSPHELVRQYHFWGGVERVDALYRGDSVMGLLATIIPGAWPDWPVQVIGTLILLLPLAMRREAWKDAGCRQRFLCSLLLYVVLFNHKAERSSFVIAAAGVVIWYLGSRRGLWRTVLLLASLVGLKAPPCVLVWIAVQTDLWRGQKVVAVAEP